MDSATGTAITYTAIRQQDMIHAASAKHRVVHAHGNAGTQQCVEDDGDLTGCDFTDVKAYPFAVRRMDPSRNGRS
jgi:NAD-dependent SIR2 family protein deacetylase